MKKFLYLCAMMTLSMNMMAQIDLNDQNWHGSLIENFDETVSYWQWHTNNFSNHDYTWKAFVGNRIGSNGYYHLYQFDHARYDSINGNMRLVSNYVTGDSITGGHFYLPTNGASYGSTFFDDKLYFSGAIEYVKNIWHPEQGKFQYGYFEIRCKLPKHQGAHPAFWLHNASTNADDPYYEEIDIFEYSWSNGDPKFHYHPYPNPEPSYAGDPNVITTGIYQNFYGDSINYVTDTYARNYPKLPSGAPDISGWHTYSCEWMPDHVYWFLDGQRVNSFYDPVHIPRHAMTLKANYAINGYNDYGGIVWEGSGEMTIDYIKVYQLEWDCDTDEVIVCQSDLDQFEYAVKKSITIAPQNTGVTVGNTDKVTFRVTDFVKATGPFEVQQGGEFKVIIQEECPD